MTSARSEKPGVATRLASVVWYERLAGVAIAATVASAAADRVTLTKYYSQNPIFYPIAIVSVLAIQLLWVWLIARKRRNWARWISLVLTVLGIPTAILDFGARVQLNVTAAIAYYVAFVLWIIAVALLFHRDARGWFDGKRFAPDAN
jgi:lysylphosphatidylglycerol synthetase-like protein (DUF2156 family)